MKNQISKYILFKPNSETILNFDFSELSDIDLIGIFNFFNSIFSVAKSYQPEIDFDDFFEYIRELHQFLNHIKFFDYVESGSPPTPVEEVLLQLDLKSV